MVYGGQAVAYEVHSDASSHWPNISWVTTPFFIWLPREKPHQAFHILFLRSNKNAGLEASGSSKGIFALWQKFKFLSSATRILTTSPFSSRLTVNGLLSNLASGATIVETVPPQSVSLLISNNVRVPWYPHQKCFVQLTLVSAGIADNPTSTDLICCYYLLVIMLTHCLNKFEWSNHPPASMYICLEYCHFLGYILKFSFVKNYLVFLHDIPLPPVNLSHTNDNSGRPSLALSPQRQWPSRIKRDPLRQWHHHVSGLRPSLASLSFSNS